MDPRFSLYPQFIENARVCVYVVRLNFIKGEEKAEDKMDKSWTKKSRKNAQTDTRRKRFLIWENCFPFACGAGTPGRKITVDFASIRPLQSALYRRPWCILFEPQLLALQFWGGRNDEIACFSAQSAHRYTGRKLFVFHGCTTNCSASWFNLLVTTAR